MIDSHAHLEHPALVSDLPGVLERARSAGLDAILSVCCVEQLPGQVDSFLEMIERCPGVYGGLGVHPHDAHRLSPTVEAQILGAMSHPKVLAWGEIGLDFYYENSPRHVQEEAFRRQLRHAKSAGKPVIIHSRDAERETCEILAEEFGDSRPRAGVMHCFAYGPETASLCLGLGLYLGFGGILTFPRAEESRGVAASVESDFLLIETDAPYLAPVPFRGKTNEPSFVVKVAEKLAEIRKTSVDAVGRQSSSNFRRLFGLSVDMENLNSRRP